MPSAAELVQRTRTALGDAWEAEGRLRQSVGGAVAGLRDMRLMASGLPHAQWNSADVTGPNPDIAGARAFYARRSLPWGIRLPVEMPCAHGRHAVRLSLMALPRGAFRPVHGVAGLEVALAGPNQLESVVAIDAAGFGDDPQTNRPWIEPHLGAAEVETAVAAIDGRPVATAYTVRTEARAGPALYVGGVTVVAEARQRGVAAAITSWLLRRGFAGGAELAHLHADGEASARVFRRLGFEEAGELDVYEIEAPGYAEP
jgi:ribosomal protein S18 acetylase RimI-like enzyme